MSYETCQDGLATVIKKLKNYTDNNVSLGDYRLLQRGFNQVVILRPGTFTRMRSEFGGGKQNTWNIIVELFIKYKDDAQIQENIRDERQDIIDQVDQYPKLDNVSGVFDAQIISGAEPTPVFGADGSGPHFMMQEMICQIIEDIEVTELE